MDDPMTLAGDVSSFVRAEIQRRMTPTTAVGTVVASPGDIPIASDRLLVTVDGSSLAAPVKRARGLLLQAGMRVGLQKFGADWVVTCVIVDPVRDERARPLNDLIINSTTPHTSTTSETICQPVTFYASDFGVYMALWVGTWQSGVSGDVVRFRLRLEAGTTVTTSSTQLIQQTQVCQVSNQSQPFVVMAGPIGPPIFSSTFTVAGSIQRAAGSGSCTVNGNSLDMEAIALLRVG
jgi:hypothetical protein